MKSQEFISIKKKEKKLTVDFSSSTCSVFSAYSKKDKIVSGAWLIKKEGAEALPGALIPVKVFDTALGTLFFCTDGHL